MSVRWAIALADVRPEDVDTSTKFWAAVTGGRVGEPEGGLGQFVAVEHDGEDSYLAVQRLQSPDPTARWHLDLLVDDLAAATQKAVHLGARVVSGDEELTIAESPAGAVFCLIASTLTGRGPTKRSWPGGHHSLADQVCLDIGADAFDAEADFWSQLTGWERRRGTRPEFDHLVRPAAVPLRLLLQRLDESGRPARFHLDLACDDVAAETARHRALGATVQHVREHWTVLRDPAGLDYCITARTP